MARKGYFEKKLNRKIGSIKGRGTRAVNKVLNPLVGIALIIFVVIALIRSCIEKVFG